MDFDWLDVPFDLRKVTPKEIEESFEDPFGLRLLPEGMVDDEKARFFNLGRSVNGRNIFSVFWSDGKRYRVIFSRDMVSEEIAFYDRKNSEQNY
jgi:hypothetical protein